MRVYFYVRHHDNGEREVLQLRVPFTTADPPKDLSLGTRRYEYMGYGGGYGWK